MPSKPNPLGNLEGDVLDWWPTESGYIVRSHGLYSGGATRGEQFEVGASSPGEDEDRAIFDALMFECPKSYRWHDQFGPVQP